MRNIFSLPGTKNWLSESDAEQRLLFVIIALLAVEGRAPAPGCGMGYATPGCWFHIFPRTAGLERPSDEVAAF